MECKAALKEANGNLEEANTILRKRGLAQAAKKSGRSTSEGLDRLLHPHGRQDRRPGGDQLRVGFRRPHGRFSDAAEGSGPAGRGRQPAVRRGARTCRRTCWSASAASIARRWKSSGKPANVIDKIVEGKLGSFYEQVVLLDQASIRDPKTTVGQLLQAAIAKLGENISIAALRAIQGRRRELRVVEGRNGEPGAGPRLRPREPPSRSDYNRASCPRSRSTRAFC